MQKSAVRIVSMFPLYLFMVIGTSATISSSAIGQTPPGPPPEILCLFDSGYSSCDRLFGGFNPAQTLGCGHIPCTYRDGQVLCSAPQVRFVSVAWEEFRNERSKGREAIGNEFVTGYLGTLTDFVCRQVVICDNCEFNVRLDDYGCATTLTGLAQIIQTPTFVRDPEDLQRVACPPDIQ